MCVRAWGYAKQINGSWRYVHVVIRIRQMLWQKKIAGMLWPVAVESNPTESNPTAPTGQIRRVDFSLPDRSGATDLSWLIVGKRVNVWDFFLAVPAQLGMDVLSEEVNSFFNT